MTGVIEAYDMKNLLRKVNPKSANLWHWTRLLCS
jgi:hypothetical protein